jgi:hypothetical protein
MYFFPVDDMFRPHMGHHQVISLLLRRALHCSLAHCAPRQVMTRMVSLHAFAALTFLLCSCHKRGLPVWGKCL